MRGSVASVCLDKCYVNIKDNYNILKQAVKNLKCNIFGRNF